MKKIFIFLIIIIVSFFIKIPKYVELNHLVIIKSINVKCINNNYMITLKEVIPIKDNYGIKYTYRKYVEVGNNLKYIKLKFEENNKKKIYYKDTKKLVTNCKNIDDITNVFQINPIVKRVS